MTNCVNCGAPLHGNKCQYCGTEYAGQAVTAEFNLDDYTGTLSIGGKEYRVYIAEMRVEHDSMQDLTGTTYTTCARHEFTLIEM